MAKFCPLSFTERYANKVSECMKEECGWFNKDSRECSMISIAKTADIYANTVDGHGNITIGKVY